MKEKRTLNMKKLFRRNQIIITVLAIMIAAAGYLNYTEKSNLEAGTSDILEPELMEISDEDLLYENQTLAGDIMSLDDPETVADGGYIDTGESLADASADTKEAGIDNPGEAVLTGGRTVSEYIAGVQLNREQVRAKNTEILNSIINNTELSQESRQGAIKSLVDLTAISEKENAAETLLLAKGFADPVVSISDEKVDVIVNAAALSDAQKAQIEDIVKRKTDATVDHIVITLLKVTE